MIWGDKRYRSFNYEMRKIFGEKVMKLSLDGGFTCPNRDGTIGNKGCIFCGEEGSGEFAASRYLPIREQMEQQKKLLSKKWPVGKSIAYFQSFTNTYAPIVDLEKKYTEAIVQNGIVGLAIATRPDCLSKGVLDLLSKFNEKTFLWIELGLQTIYDNTSKFIRRGYELECYERAVEELNKRNIKVVTHLIFGLPNESHKDILSSVKYVANTNTWGVKFHTLYIQKGTDLYKHYERTPFPILSREEYISLVCNSIERLPQDMVIHRLTGDGKRELLVEPKWTLDKLKVLSGIDMELKRRNSFQGSIKV
ncbi:MAG TPA: TIGR01212 family radical SAM protein [Tissierellales bacterium]|nr:TIGR01212 family radical SAM protein [Tissierellales bacterium]